MKPLTPLFADLSQSSELRADLGRVRRHQTAFAESAGLLQLRAAMNEGAAPSGGVTEELPLAPRATDTVSPLHAARAWHWSVKLLLVAALGGAGLATLSSLGGSAPPRAARAPVARVAPAPVLVAPVIETIASPAQPEPVRALVEQPPLRAASTAKLDDDRSRREIEQLLRVRALLPSDPAGALRLAQRSSREFPDGTLREEREALLVLALSALGEHERAGREARAFVARYPESPLRARLRPLLEP